MSDVKNPFEHIIYEIDMYLYTYDILPNGIDLHDQMMKNINIDSRAIHLRNLAVFFAKAKKGKYWHASDYVNNCNNIRLIDDNMLEEIKNYTSRATCHLLDQRLDENYKADTIKCYMKAFPKMIDAITDFIKALQTNVKSEYKALWEDSIIQRCASNDLNCIMLRAPRMIEYMRNRCEGNV